MLPDRYSELLTAYVDGELSPRQQKVVQDLLHRSAEARAFCRQLQADADLLRGLPPRKLGADFSQQVVEAIGQTSRPAMRPPPGARRVVPWPAWSGWAAAAAILLAVGVLSYLAFPLFSGDRRPAQVVVRPETNRPETPPRDGAPLEAFPGQDDDQTDDEAIQKDGPAKRPPRERHVAPVRPTGPPRDAMARRRRDAWERPGPDSFLTFGGDAKLPPLASPNLSLMLPLQTLADKPKADRLRMKLYTGPAFHIDLLCRDTAQGLRDVQAAFEAFGLRVLIDRQAEARLKNPRLPTKYALYLENVTPDELIALFGQLARGERQKATLKKAEQFGIFSIYVMSNSARDQINRFLRAAEPSKRPAKAKGKGKGKPRAAAKTSAGPARSRLVLILAYQENNSPVVANPRLSQEVKRFLANRPSRRPGTLQVVLVLSRDNI
jgi:hypothetical protein